MRIAIIGAGMGGLAAAKAVAPHFEKVMCLAAEDAETDRILAEASIDRALP